MKKNISFIQAILISSALLSANLFAAPENPRPITADNDGDTIVIRKMGDEHYRFTQTLDGYMVVRDAKGVYYYANEQGEISSVKVRSESRRSAKEKAFLKALNKKKVMLAYRKKNPDRLPRYSNAERPAWVPTANKHPLLRLPQASVHVKGTNTFPVIMISAPGNKNSADSASVFMVLNQENLSSNGYTGSVHDYFVDQSSGIFTPSFDLFYVTVDNALNSYEKREATLIKEAILKLSSKYPDFDASKYDSDGDGVIDAAGFLFAGTNENLGGFQYELNWNEVYVSAGGRQFNKYFIISDENYFAVFIHEFSHTMGLRDHYCVENDECYSDYSNSSTPAPGTHFWDVMSTGMYANNGLTPPGYSGFERNFMGWMDYKDINFSSEVTTITPLNTTNVAYKVSVYGDDDEWWVLENRQKTKWDAHLPNSGMLIWHIDYDQETWDGNEVNNTPDHQRIDVVEAGNVKVNNYESGFEARYFYDDPFPGSQNVTSFGPFTSWAGVSQEVQLYNITEKNGNVCFATQDGVDVNECIVTETSSSSEAVSCSSVQVEQSSSSNQDESSSSIVPDSATSSVVKADAIGNIQVAIAGKTIRIDSSSEGIKTVTIFDLQGNVVSSKLFRSSVDFDMYGKSKNVFIIRVMDNHRMIYSKVLKI